MRHEREHAEQVALFQWAEIQSRAMPELRLMFAIPNGGHRRPGVAGKLKAEGVKAGTPDIFLPTARHGFHGLFIELKAKGNRATREQVARMMELDAEGYMTAICVGWEAAAKTLTGYLKHPKAKA